jgi:hypothetical protein
VLLLQTRELGVEFALILIVHGCVLTDKHDEIAAAEAAACWNILPARAPRKPNRFHSHDWLQINRNTCMRHFAFPVDSAVHLCTLGSPDRT